MSLGVLIPLSLGLGLIGLCAFLWALRNGQFDDPDGAAWRVIPPDTADRPVAQRRAPRRPPMPHPAADRKG